MVAPRARGRCVRRLDWSDPALLAGVVQLSVVGGRGAKVTLDINGYEFALSFEDDGLWTFALDDGEDDEGMSRFVAHLVSFVMARKRSLADVLKECQCSFGKFVKDDGSASDGDIDNDDGDENEYEKWVDEEPVKKPKKQRAFSLNCYAMCQSSTLHLHTSRSW